MWLLFIVSLAFADGVTPKRPEKSGEKPGQCPKAYPVIAGTVPGFSTCPSTCSGVLLPTSVATDCVKLEDWAVSLERSCNTQILKLNDDLYAARKKEKYTQNEKDEKEVKTPRIPPPTVDNK